MSGNWLKFFLPLIFSGFALLFAQHTTAFQTDKNKFSLRFQLVNNLIVIPVTLNEQHKMNLVLDTGSPYTILLDFQHLDSLIVKRGQQITIGGLGNGYSIQAYDSRFNTLQLANAVKNDLHLIVVLDTELQLSKYLGMPVHGITGFDIMKDFVVEINYRSQKITFYKHDYFDKIKRRKLIKFHTFPLEFYQKKPYVRSSITANNYHVDSANFLVDTGGWDAVWWFENSSPHLPVPAKHFQDTLGIGINGPITGFRSKTDEFIMDKFRFRKPTTSFPDSVSLANAVTFEGRNGSIGGEILHRFNVIFDYKNQEMMLRPNKDYHKEFHYNMSGMKFIKPYTLLPWLEVTHVRLGSPAYNAGIMQGDLITSVNGEHLEDGDLGRINKLIKSQPGKKITVSLLRNGNQLVKSFELKDEL